MRKYRVPIFHTILSRGAVIVLAIVLPQGCIIGDNAVDDHSIDTQASLSINDNALYTLSKTVTLKITCENSEIFSHVMFSNIQDFTGAEWIPYTETIEWTLTGEAGEKTVFMRLKGSEGIARETFSASIVYVEDINDVAPVVVINNGSEETEELNVTLDINVEYAFMIESMMISNTEDFTGGEWEDFIAEKTWSLASGIGTRTVYVKLLAVTGDEIVATASINVIDVEMPFGAEIFIENGATTTETRTVGVQLFCEDNNSVVEMLLYIDDRQDASWIPYQPQTEVSLSPGYGLKNIYAVFRDAGGNESDVVSAQILYEEPQQTTIAIEPLEIIFADISGDTSFDVIIRGAVNMISARLHITFDPAIFEVHDITTSGMGFILSDFGTTVIESEKMIDNDTGTIIVGILGMKENFTGVGGEGILLRITGTIRSRGSMRFEFIRDSEKGSIIYTYSPQGNDCEEADVVYESGWLTIQ